MQESKSKTLARRRLLLRSSLVLAVARLRFHTTVAQVVSRELERWESSARRIGNPALRSLALGKLQEEGLNAKAAAMLATLATRRSRSDVAEAVVALEVLYDYLDGRSETPLPAKQRTKPEQPPPDPVGDGLRTFQWLTKAVSPPTPGIPQTYAATDAADGPYLAELSATISHALDRLPGTHTIRGVLKSAATRGAEAQAHAHAVRQLGSDQLERWARSHAAGSGLEWREFMAGAAASVLAMHALITAASNPHLTRDEAIAIHHAYMPVCAIATLLDGLVDHASDAAGGEYSYICTYESHEQLTGALVRLSGEALQLNRYVRRRAGHVMTLTGVVAYYATAPGADTEFARPAIDALQAQLGGIVTPVIALIRHWRHAKRRVDSDDRRTLAQIDEPAPSH